MSAVSQPQAAPSPLEKSPSTAILCNTCGNVCKGEVLRVQDKYFHIKCFICKACGCDLAEGGFFVRQGEYICTLDYQRLYGTRCFSCDQFIEGEVVSALGKTYHPDCFVCAVCRLPFPPGDRVTFNGKECMCQKCSLPVSVGSSAHLSQGLRSCGGCGTEIKNGQALVALDKHWHLGCFKCKSCGKLLNAEYISKDGLPYCEADYHAKFGIRCDSCEKYITGRVLEAGEKHYHPSCALCVRCGQMFAEGEEMYLQGSSIWHPACRQAARTEDRNKETRTSSESIISVPASSTSGSPSRVIYLPTSRGTGLHRARGSLPEAVELLRCNNRGSCEQSASPLCHGNGILFPDACSPHKGCALLAPPTSMPSLNICAGGGGWVPAWGDGSACCLGPQGPHGRAGSNPAGGGGWGASLERWVSLLSRAPGPPCPMAELASTLQVVVDGVPAWGDGSACCPGPQDPHGRAGSNPKAPGHLSLLSTFSLLSRENRAGTVSVGTSSCLSLSQHPSPTSVFRHHYIPYFR
ncbi:hypothetical protein CR201_G0040810, partial [Pongo abelii]